MIIIIIVTTIISSSCSSSSSSLSSLLPLISLSLSSSLSAPQFLRSLSLSPLFLQRALLLSRQYMIITMKTITINSMTAYTFIRNIDLHSHLWQRSFASAVVLPARQECTNVSRSWARIGIGIHIFKCFFFLLLTTYSLECLIAIYITFSITTLVFLWYESYTFHLFKMKTKSETLNRLITLLV